MPLATQQDRLHRGLPGAFTCNKFADRLKSNRIHFVNPIRCGCSPQRQCGMKAARRCSCARALLRTACTYRVRYCRREPPTPILDTEPMVKDTLTSASHTCHTHLTCRTNKDRACRIICPPTRIRPNLTFGSNCRGLTIACALQMQRTIQHAAPVARFCICLTSKSWRACVERQDFSRHRGGSSSWA